MCKIPCFQRGSTTTAVYTEVTLLSKGVPTAVVMCKYLAFKGAQISCFVQALFFQRAPQPRFFLVLHISIWGGRSFLWGLSGDWIEFLTPVTACPPTIGGVECC